MRLSSQIRPISYLETHAAEIVHTVGESREPLVITQNGEPKMVIQDIESYEEMQESVALLKFLSLGSQEIESGHVQPASEAIEQIRERRKER